MRHPAEITGGSLGGLVGVAWALGVPSDVVAAAAIVAAAVPGAVTAVVKHGGLRPMLRRFIGR